MSSQSPELSTAKALQEGWALPNKDDWLEALRNLPPSPPRGSPPPQKVPESDIEYVRDLLSRGVTILPSTFLDAVHDAMPDSLDLLLSAGVDPNLHLESADDLVSDVEETWAAADPSLDFGHLKDISYPLHLAAYVRQYDPEKHACMIRALLKHGANLYATFRQPFCRGHRDDRAAFPGEDPPPWVDPLKPLVEPEYTSLEDACRDWEDPYNIDVDVDWAPIRYGLRDVVHAILEDGGYIRPILEYPDILNILDLEHRDPQGRTLLLSACRSLLGADAKFDCTAKDLARRVHVTNDYFRNPFPDHNPYENADKSANPPTVLYALLTLGADPLATDNQRKNALHHLLEASRGATPPMIRYSLQYMAAHFPSLLGQPTHSGLYPIHAALRRLRLYADPYDDDDWRVRDSALEECVEDLIAAGANVRNRDGRGNTVLHYLADNDLAYTPRGESRRALFYSFLDEHGCAADINVRNNAGKTAVRLLLDKAGERDELGEFLSHQDTKASVAERDQVDAEIFGRLNAAGVIWDEIDENGRSLLHAVASHHTDRALWRCKFLLEKGIDPSLRDAEGKTARDLAVSRNSKAVFELLETYEPISGTES